MMIDRIDQQVMTRQEAREIVDKINAHALEIGRLLLLLKESGGWEALGYESWTKFLESEFIYSRKHLYELMRAAPITERLVTKGYREIPVSQALILAQLPITIQESVYETAYNRAQGKPTTDQIKAIGETFAEALATGGYVTTNDGEQNALENAISSNRKEQEILKREGSRCYIVNGQTIGGAIYRPHSGTAQINLEGLDQSQLNQLAQAIENHAPIFLNLWTEG